VASGYREHHGDESAAACGGHAGQARLSTGAQSPLPMVSVGEATAELLTPGGQSAVDLGELQIYDRWIFAPSRRWR